MLSTQLIILNYPPLQTLCISGSWTKQPKLWACFLLACWWKLRLEPIILNEDYSKTEKTVEYPNYVQLMTRAKTRQDNKRGFLVLTLKLPDITKVPIKQACDENEEKYQLGDY